MIRRRIRRAQTRPNPVVPAAPAAPAFCTKCKAELAVGTPFCGQCGTPVRAGIKRKSAMGEVRRRIEKGRNVRHVRSGRNTLLVLGLLNLGLFAIVYLYYRDTMEQIVQLYNNVEFRENLLAQGISMHELDQAVWAARHWGTLCFVSCGLPGLIFIGLYIWAAASPLPAIVAGMVTYLTSIAANVVLDPKTLLSPIAWLIRLTVLGFLTAAIQAASTERRMREREEKIRREKMRAERAAQAAVTESVEADGGV